MHAIGTRPEHAIPMDQIARRVLSHRKKPHPALVVASMALAVGLWFVIYAVSGRLIWFW